MHAFCDTFIHLHTHASPLQLTPQSPTVPPLCLILLLLLLHPSRARVALLHTRAAPCNMLAHATVCGCDSRVHAPYIRHVPSCAHVHVCGLHVPSSSVTQTWPNHGQTSLTQINGPTCHHSLATRRTTQQALTPSASHMECIESSFIHKVAIHIRST